MEYLLCLFYTALFIFIIYRASFFEVYGLSKKQLSIIFLLKIVAGTTLWAIYSYYYTDRSSADIFRYFDDGKVMYNALFTHPSDYFKMLFGVKNNTAQFLSYYEQMNGWHRRYDSNLYNDSHVLIRFHALADVFSLGHYHVHTIFICFFTMIGLTGIYKFFINELKDKSLLLAFCIFLVPSVILWTSGVLKEALIICFLGMILYFVKEILLGRARIFFIPSLLFCIWLLFSTKFYVLVALTPALIAFIWVYKSHNRFILLKYVTAMLVYLVLAQCIRIFIPAYDPIEILRIKQKDFIYTSTGCTYLKNDSMLVMIKPQQRNTVYTADSIHYMIKAGTKFSYINKKNPSDTLYAISKSDSVKYRMEDDIPETPSRIYLPLIEDTPLSLLKNIPIAIHNSLLRPVILNKNSLMVTIAAIQDWLLFIYILISLIFSKPFNRIDWNVVLMCLLYTLIMYLIIGWTTPVLGAIVRYRSPAVPFLLIAFLHVLDLEKLKRLLKPGRN